MSKKIRTEKQVASGNEALTKEELDAFMLESMAWIKKLDFSKRAARDSDKQLSQKTIGVL